MQERLTRFGKNDQKAYSFGTKDPVEVHIEKHCWSKMHGWCQAAKSEVSGMGLAVWEGNIIRVYDVFLPLQYCSGAYTELDELKVNKLESRILKKGGNLDHFRFWWHTHYNFNTFWSGTDDDNAQRLVKMNENWQLSLVINQAGNWLARLDTVQPMTLTIDQLQVYLVKNSKKIKRKRNFASDIERWVKPYSDLPDRQKTNYAKVVTSIVETKAVSAGETKNEEPKPTTHDYRPSWMMDRYKERFGDHGYKEEKQKDSFGPHHPSYQGSQPEEKTKFFSNGYVLHEGIFMTRTLFDQKVAEKLAEQEAAKTPTSVECKCPHVGTWEACVCPSDCDKCIEMMSTMGYC